MVKFKRLKILKFRNIAPNVEIHFDDGINILLGKNATGKTTLLNIISSCLRTGLPVPLKEEFHVEYNIKINEVEIEVKIWSRERKLPEPKLTSESQKIHNFEDKSFFDFGYEAKLKSHQKMSIIIKQNSEEFAGIKVSINDGSEKDMPKVTWDGSLSLPIFLLFKMPSKIIGREYFAIYRQTIYSWLECTYAYRFDESLEVYKIIIGQQSGELPIPKLMFHKNSVESHPSDFTITFVPITFVEHLLPRMPKFDPDKENDILITKEDFAAKNNTTEKGPNLLERLEELLEVQEVKLSFSNLEKKTLPNESFEYEYGVLKFRLIKKDGSEISNTKLSYGQKRLLAFYYFLETNPNVVIADELVNGFHHLWIEKCLAALGERQSFLTSQNPLLLDYLTLESAKQAERRFVVCRLDQSGKQEKLVWENIKQEQAQELYESYEVGIQHLGEILRINNLW